MKKILYALVVGSLVLTGYAVETSWAESNNPCSSKVKQIRKYPLNSMDDVMERAEKLGNDTSLGKSGTSCATCHPDGADLKNEPYPRYIEMADDILTLDQMINFCMMNPMKGKPIKWNHQRMTALAAYVKTHSDGYGHPCGMKHPCGSNPCSMKHPCGMNPCGMR